ncbi:MAG: hypothetical protein AAF196_17005 [Planctomycetota bacterium]
MATLIVAVLVWRLGGRVPLPTTLEPLLSGVLNICALCAGLLGIALSILLAVRDTETVKVLERNGKLRILVGYVHEGIGASLAATLMCCVSLWMCGVEGETWINRRTLGIVTVSAIALQMFTTWRIVRLVFSLLNHAK